MTRPARLVAVVGTGTDVGKTWVIARLVEMARRSGVAVSARKPVQSFASEEREGTDAHILGAASGEDPHLVCPPDRWLEIAMAPPMAAAVLGRSLPALTGLVEEISWPERSALGFVETVGGVRSPLTVDGDSGDLTAALGPDVVLLVADAGLGTINDCRLATRALAPLPVVVALNRFETGNDLHDRNLHWLRDQCAMDAWPITDSRSLGELVDRLTLDRAASRFRRG